MKKKVLLCLLALLIVLLPVSAFADEIDIFENEFTEWVGESPYGWEFDSVNGGIERGGGEAELFTENGYAFISTMIELDPSSAYRISADVSVYDVPADNIGANINIKDQYADAGYLSGTTSEVIDLYVQTNVDDTQLYTLRIGLGNEQNYTTGSLSVDSVKITELDTFPDDANVYTLIGSFSFADIIGEEEQSVEEENTSVKSVASYNTVGMVLVGLLFSLLFWLFFTSRWSARFAARVSEFRFMTLLFLLAFLLRLFLSMRCEGHISDLNCFKAWAVNLQSYGLSGFYESGIFADYMPGYYYILYVIGGLYDLFGMTYESTSFRMLVELVPILCDLALAFFAYRIVRKDRGCHTASLAAIFLLYIPFVFTDSAVWGQIDSVFTIALLGALWLLSRDKKIYACLLWAVALMIKPQALLAAPVIAIVFLKDLFTKGRFKKTFFEALLSILGICAAVLLISLPMKGSQPLLYIVDRMINTTGQYAYGTVNAFNLFGFLDGNYTVDTDPAFFGLSYRTLGWILILLSTLFIAWLYFKKGKKKDVLLFSGLYLLLIYISAHNMHERYSYPALIFLAIAAFQRDSRELLFPVSVLSGLFFANMYIVLEFGQEFIYPWITTLFSVLFVLAAVLTVIVSVRSLFHDCDHPIISPDESAPQKFSPAQLKSAPHVDRRMKGKDWLVMLIITAVYSVAMLTNLGSTNIPAGAEVWAEDDPSPVIIELSEESYIGQLKYYTGYCAGTFKVSVSTDGEVYYDTYSGEINHEHAKMFRWYTVDIDDTAKYIRIEKTSGYLELREVAFFDTDNVLIDSTSEAYLLTDNGRTDAPWLIDEQNEAPAVTDYMTEMYFDEVYHARTAYEYLNGIYPYEVTHPPLGKAFISLGIMLFGMNPFGWRFAGAVAGILMIPVLYVFAKRIFRKTRYAAMSAILFAVDFMHWTLSRIATIDSFTLLFILLMYLCMYEYTQHNFHNEKLPRTFLPLGLCGLFFALGAATKWISLYAGLGLAIIFFYTIYQRSAEYRVLKQENDPRATFFRKKLLLTLLFCIGVFIILPVTVYCLSYLPYEWTSPDGFGIRGILDNQSYMFNYHGYLSADPHPYASEWQTWPFSIRPVFFFLSSGAPAGEIALIWCMGNPLLWWSGVLAFLYIAGKRKPEQKFDVRGLGFLLLAAVCQLAPNLLITREMFLYHYFTLVPFMCMGIVYVLRHISETHPHGKTAVIVYLAILCGLFILFYPVITGTPIDYDFGKSLQWFKTWPI